MPEKRDSHDPQLLQAVSAASQVRLGDFDACRPAGLPKGKALKEAARREGKRIKKLQPKLYADARFALLVVLQGRDAAGKDGTVKKVFRAVNPMGCEVTSFKAPTEAELQHDFLWRGGEGGPQGGKRGV